MASLFDEPATKHPSVWPEKPLTKDSPVLEVVSRLPDYIERAREALLCIESRAARAAGAVSDAERAAALNDVAAECRTILPELARMRRTSDALIEFMKSGKSEPELI